MKLLHDFHTTRDYFIAHLPVVTMRVVVFKLITTIIAGLILSIVFVTFGAFLIEQTGLSNQHSYSLMIILQDLGILIVTLVVFYRNKNINIFPTNPKRTNKLRKHLLLGNIIFVVLFTLITQTISLVHNYSDTISSLQKYINMGEDRITINYLFNYLIGFITLIFIAFTEEFIFRHTFFRFLRKHGLILSILFSSILFHIIHGQIFHIGFVYGIILCLYYEYTNDFKGIVITHTINNFLLSFVPFYAAHMFVLLLT